MVVIASLGIERENVKQFTGSCGISFFVETNLSIGWKSKSWESLCCEDLHVQKYGAKVTWTFDFTVAERGLRSDHGEFRSESLGTNHKGACSVASTIPTVFGWHLDTIGYRGIAFVSFDESVFAIRRKSIEPLWTNLGDVQRDATELGGVNWIGRIKTNR